MGRPKRDISTIIHILNDLLCASPQYRTEEAGAASPAKPAPGAAAGAPVEVAQPPGKTDAPAPASGRDLCGNRAGGERAMPGGARKGAPREVVHGAASVGRVSGFDGEIACCFRVACIR